MKHEITIDNPSRSRKWGWGWSCTPTPEDNDSIEKPTRPDYTGTLNQLAKAIASDPTYRAMLNDGTFTTTAMFYDGKRIVDTWAYGLIDGGECTCGQNYYNSCNCWYKNQIYGYGWFSGLVIDDEDEKPLKIRVAN